MENELFNYMKEKVDALAEMGIHFPDEKLNQVYNNLVELDASLEEKKQKIDTMYEQALKDREKEILNDKAMNGEYSNFDKIKEVVDIISKSPISNLVTIYGGSVPYLLTGETPKRLIGDIDLSVDLEHIDEVREYISTNPELFKVLIDTKNYTDDHGLELNVNGLDVSIFPHENTPEGRITRNFEYKASSNTIDVKSTLFYGITDEQVTTQANINGRPMKVECPENIYIQKSIALREKDRIDLEVLNKIVNHDKITYLKSISKKPEVVESKQVKLDDGNKYENNR